MLQVFFTDEWRPAAFDRLAWDENDSNSLRDIMFLLDPFRDAQQLLEGEKYVALVPMFVHHIQTNIVMAIMHATNNHDEHLSNLASKMQEDFEARWGNGEEGSVYANNH